MLLLVFHPGFELPDRFALHRQLDVGVNGVHIFAARMTHERLADVLHDARFHEPRIERVAEVMEAVVADARAADRGLPRGFDLLNRVVVKRENQPRSLPVGKQE